MCGFWFNLYLTQKLEIRLACDQTTNRLEGEGLNENSDVKWEVDGEAEEEEEAMPNIEVAYIR